MLPLVQMHQMVPNPHPSYLDSAPPFQAHLKPEYLALHPQNRQPRPSNPYQTAGNPQRAAFPIRSSQPAQSIHHRLANSFAHGPASENREHQLRRKTPNGTIDAGYDGSPAGLATGPPPSKQMILPASSKIFPTAVVHRDVHNAHANAQGALNQQLSLSATGWPYPSQALDDSLAAAAAAGLGGLSVSSPGGAVGGGWGLVPDMMGPNGSLAGGDHAAYLQSAAAAAAAAQAAQNPYNQAARMQTVFAPSFQQAAGPTAFNPAGFNPPPVWRDASMADYRAQVPLSNLGYIPQNAAYDSAYMAAQPMLAQGLPTGQVLNHGHGHHGHGFHLPLSPFPLDDGFQQQRNLSPTMLQSPHRRMEALTLNPAMSPAVAGMMAADGSSPIRFKERVLAHAHKTYADLLLYVNHAKKANHGKSASGHRSSSKMIVFPKPPKYLSSSLSPRQHGRSRSFSQQVAAYSQGLGQQQQHHGVGGATGAGAAPGSFAGMDSAQRGGASTVVAEILNPALQKNPYASRPQRMHSFGHDMSSPLSNAKAALEMLSNLCEQSGWKWIDGMLLGGCLHYGLEHYEEALEWFKRILNLESNHVEAISNIAATLYCLNRHEEAEQHWLQAVKIRPSYLEAVEHLVGLLCSNHRSKEAVDAINFVQNSLRIQKPSRSKTGRRDSATASAREPTSASSDRSVADSERDNQDHSGGFASPDTRAQRGFGSSGYAIPGSENGRILLLIHAKGNMLYALKDIDQASEAFEEAVLISAGREIGGVRTLIQRIQAVLAPREVQGLPSRILSQTPPTVPLLLPPERAKHTAQLVFANSGGQLPGLRHIPEGSHRKSAISTTSNSLLSLAKIFQDAMSNGGSSPGLMRQPSGVGDILALYYLSLSLQESPSTANNVGILLASVQQPASDQPAPVTDVSSSPSASPNIPGIVPGSGLALALAYYNYGLNLDPKHVHLHTNLGSLLKDIGQLDLAIQMYEQAVACDGTFDIALTNLANAVKDRGRISDAIMYYRRAVTSNPEFAEAVCGLSTALNSVCDWRGRGGVVLYKGRFDRWHVDDDGMLRDVKQHGRGGGLMKRVVDIVGRQLRDASTWGCGTLNDNVIAMLASQLRDAGAGRTDRSLDIEGELRKWAGKSWEGSRVLRLIERSTRAAMQAWYQDKYIRGVEAPGGYPRPRPPAGLTIPSAPTVLPFHTFTCPLTAKDIRMISQRNALRISCSTLRSPWLPNTVYRPPPPPRPHLNIGYVSSDFNNHPLAHLMQSVFGFHDQSRAKAFCYATTASDKSVHRQQIEREAPVFRDVSTWSSDKLVEQIVRDGIHILVNLNGYTRGARNEIFAARPAPIQMSFMGFAGTLGAEWCDYLLADSTAIPPSTLRPWRNNLSLGDVFHDEADCEKDDWVYSENIIFARDTFFCCDHAQSAEDGERDMSWEDEQRRRWKMRKELFPNLSDDTIILGNFNQLYKIDPTTFRTWLRILGCVPKAVLWLLRFPELGEVNLKRTATDWAGPTVANRIIFTDVAPKQQHISRARVCDLFLDTPECNAHTTAADILWSSTPLVTLPRYQYKMCSRMAASILKGALPRGAEGEQAARELIATDEAQYESFAVKLASGLSYRITEGGYGEGSGRLAEMRQLLWRSKWTCALFDTRRWVSDLEDAYDEAWRRWETGEGGDIYL